jgi:hypothetical protein
VTASGPFTSGDDTRRDEPIPHGGVETRRDERPARQLIFLEEDVARATKVLTQFQETTKSKGNVLCDIDGHVFLKVGEHRITSENLTALVSSSFAATRDVAAILPPDDFVTLTHAGPNETVQLTHVHDRTMLATIFDQRTTAAMVCFYLKETRDQLAGLVKEIGERKAAPVDLGANFDGAAKNALEDMFGES